MKKLCIAVALLGAFCVRANDLEEVRAKIAEACSVTSVDKFHGFDRVVFDFKGYEAWVCCPVGESRPGKPWSWVMQWATAFVPRTNVPQMLRDGYHHVTINTFAHRMDEEGLRISAEFQKFLVEKLGFAPKANLIGMSWGGFFSIRYAKHYPENVAKIYLDAPLLCFKNFRIGIGPWEKRMPPAGWAESPDMPLNMAEAIAASDIPILLLYGGQDTTCPPADNCEPFIARFRAAGGDAQVVKRGLYAHHPHGVEESDGMIKAFFEAPRRVPVVAFPGVISTKTSGWAFKGEKGDTEYLPAEGLFPSKGGRLESSYFKLDKPAGENAFYRLTFQAKCAVDGYWWVDMKDATGAWLPDVNSRLFASADYQSYDVLVPMRPDADSAQIAFVAKKAVEVKDVKMTKMTQAEAAEWVMKTYKDGPKLACDVPAKVWDRLVNGRTAIKVAKDYTIVFLGDSIMNDTWCGGFDALVRQEYPDTRFRSVLSVRGSTGCWYYRMPENFEAYVGRYRPNLVVIGGISNYQRGKMSIEEARAGLQETIAKCRAIGAEVVLASPPFSGERQEGLTQERYELMKSVAEETKAAFWDMTTATYEAVEKSGKPLEWFARDAVHSNNRGKALNALMMYYYFNAAQK